VGGRPDLLSSSSDVLPLVKHMCHSKHVARHMALLPYACRNISEVSAPDLPSLTQNLMLARCSIFKSMLTSQTLLNRWWQKLCCATPNVHIAKPLGTMSGDVASSQSQQKTFTYCHRLAVCVNQSTNFLMHLRISLKGFSVYNYSDCLAVS
jgi:hypothetical protein